MMHPSESGTESRSHVMTGRSETSSVRCRSETTAGISAAEMHIVSHHCSYLRSSFCGRTKKDFCRSYGKSLAFSFGSDNCRDDGGQIRFLALSYSLLRHHATTLKCSSQYFSPTINRSYTIMVLSAPQPPRLRQLCRMPTPSAGYIHRNGRPHPQTPRRNIILCRLAIPWYSRPRPRRLRCRSARCGRDLSRSLRACNS